MNRKEHSTLSEELQHLRDSLLRDTNRGMDQQRVIEKMKAERRETICVQAHQRQELERDLCEAEKKVKHIGYPVWFVAASRGPTFHLQWYFILFLKRTMPARNYKIRPFRTVCYNTELGYRSLQGKRKCKKKKKNQWYKFSVIWICRWNNGQGGTLLTQFSTARDPFHHSYIALDTRRC